jgi:hypothetical protein
MAPKGLGGEVCAKSSTIATIPKAAIPAVDKRFIVFCFLVIIYFLFCFTHFLTTPHFQFLVFNF